MALIFNTQLKDGFKYIVEGQRGEEAPFGVTIKPIDSVRLVQLEDGLLKRDTNNSLTISTGSHNVSLCRNAITGWENLTDSEGKDIKIKKDPKGYIAEDALSMLPPSIIAEIAGVVLATSQDPATIQTFAEPEA